MISFNNSFDSMLTACREEAIAGLSTHKGFIALNKKEKDLQAKLEAVISPEAKEILINFLEAAVAVKGMEINRALLCGLTTPAKLKKHFDADTDDYRAFEENFLKQQTI
jgi:hypothetical protein